MKRLNVSDVKPVVVKEPPRAATASSRFRETVPMLFGDQTLPDIKVGPWAAETRIGMQAAMALCTIRAIIYPKLE